MSEVYIKVETGIRSIDLTAVLAREWKEQRWIEH